MLVELITEKKMSSFWRYFHHWLHWKLSFWQLPVQPVMKISSKWNFRFSDPTDKLPNKYCRWRHCPSMLHWSHQYASCRSCQEKALFHTHTRIILCVRPANERRYIVTSSLIGWAHTQNDPYTYKTLTHLPLVPHIGVSELGQHWFR